MPQNKDLKRLVRARMAETGENYTQALTHLLGQVHLEPLPSPWRMTGSHAPDYEAGLLPGPTTKGTGWRSSGSVRPPVNQPASARC